MNNKRKVELGLLGCVLLASLFLNIYNNDFPLGYHIDEVNKVYFVLSGNQDFGHPIMMLQVVRVVNAVLGFSDGQDVVRLGRTVMAAFGMLIVLVSYYLVRRINQKYALLVALAVAVSPILVVHAHYFKEDIIFTFFTLLSLLFFIKYVEKTDRTAVCYLGLVVGAALAAKYVGALLPGLFLIMPLFVSRLRRLAYYKDMFLCAAIAAGVFGVVNYPMFFDFYGLYGGFSYEFEHFFTGHTLKLYPYHFFFSYHLLYSVVPGITLVITLLAGFGVVERLVGWKKVGWRERVLVIYTLLFYLALESSPTKPPPDFMRYMLPIVPVLLYFSMTSVERLSHFIFNKSWSVAFLFLSLLVLGIPLYETLRLDYYLNNDTRVQIEELVDGNTGETLYGRHATNGPGEYDYWYNMAIKDMRSRNFSTIVVSSFEYDRYALGGTLKGQDASVYDISRKYSELFQYPYEEIKPAYKSFGFSNPTIRIVDVGGGKVLDQ